MRHTPAKISCCATAAALVLALLPLNGCHSYHVDATIENRSGVAVNLLEVDYPSASFGTPELAPDAVFHYQMQFRNSGPIKVQYAGPNGNEVQIVGPQVAERQEGTMQIVLLPNGKAEFHPQLTPAH